MASVHGDDYVSSALSEDLDWLERQPGKANEHKTQRTKPDGDKQVEAPILNRVVRRTKDGVRNGSRHQARGAHH